MALEGIADEHVESITISNSIFVNNTADKASAIYTSISSRVDFVNLNIQGNTNTKDNGFIVIKNQVTNPTSTTSIKNCSFTENTTVLGHGGIYIENVSSDKEGAKNLSVEDSVFSNNYAQQAAAIYISTCSWSDYITIRRTSFENNVSDERGAVYASLDVGIMEIYDNIFRNNTGIESCIAIDSNSYSHLAPSYTKLRNNTFT